MNKSETKITSLLPWQPYKLLSLDEFLRSLQQNHIRFVFVVLIISLFELLPWLCFFLDLVFLFVLLVLYMFLCICLLKWPILPRYSIFPLQGPTTLTRHIIIRLPRARSHLCWHRLIRLHAANVDY